MALASPPLSRPISKMTVTITMLANTNAVHTRTYKNYVELSEKHWRQFGSRRERDCTAHFEDASAPAVKLSIDFAEDDID